MKVMIAKRLQRGVHFEEVGGACNITYSDFTLSSAVFSAEYLFCSMVCTYGAWSLRVCTGLCHVLRIIRLQRDKLYIWVKKARDI